MSVQDFLTRLASIKRAPWQGDKAPHKPVLLLAVADWFDNGLARCPNLHTAFDAGLISLCDDYTVLVREKLIESDSVYSLKALKGRKIRLPKERKFWPGREWVRWQRTKTIFN